MKPERIAIIYSVTRVWTTCHVRKLSPDHPLHSLGYRWQVVERNTDAEGHCRRGGEEIGAYAPSKGGALRLAAERQQRYDPRPAKGAP